MYGNEVKEVPLAGNGEEDIPRRRLYSVPRAAEALDLSPRKTWELVYDGSLPTVRVGRRRLVTDAALDAYVAALTSVRP